MFGMGSARNKTETRPEAGRRNKAYLAILLNIRVNARK
jgi:hypothetical protein